MFLSILIPCLNENKTILRVIAQAAKALKDNGIKSAEIIVADNGSTDGTIELIKKQKVAKLIEVPIKGYGAALHYGLLKAKGEFVLYADADLSYNFSELSKFLNLTNTKEHDLILGSRFIGKIMPGSMPFSHRYFGTPLLTLLIRLIYKLPTTDCNSGMRMLRRNFYQRLKMRNSGMEWASELLIKTAIVKGKYAEVPITLYPDKRGRKPHLIPWSDGWRHLKAIVLLKPDCLLVLVAFSLLLSIYTLNSNYTFSMLTMIAGFGMFLSWSAAHLINFAVLGVDSAVSSALLKLPLTLICGIATITCLGYLFFISISSQQVELEFLFLFALVITADLWLFFIETVKTHFLYKLPENLIL